MKIHLALHHQEFHLKLANLLFLSLFLGLILNCTSQATLIDRFHASDQYQDYRESGMFYAQVASFFTINETNEDIFLANSGERAAFILFLTEETNLTYKEN